MKYMILIFLTTFAITILSCNSSKNSRKKKSSNYSSSKKSNALNTTTQKNTKKYNYPNSSKTAVNTTKNNTVETDVNLGSTDNYFKILSATSKKSVGGVAGSGSNTRYTLQIKLTENADIKLLNLWVGNSKSIPLTSFKAKVNTAGSTATYVANYKYLPDYMKERIRQNGETLPAEGVVAPKEFNGSGLVSYNVNGTIEYKEISKISKEQTQYMP